MIAISAPAVIYIVRPNICPEQAMISQINKDLLLISQSFMKREKKNVTL